MAKVKIELDTEDGSLNVSINGKAVENVECVSVHRYTDSYRNKPEVGCSISTKTVDDGGVRTYTNICAEQSVEGRTALRLGTTRSDFDDFLVNPVVKPDTDGAVYSEATANVKKVFSQIFGSRRETQK